MRPRWCFRLLALAWCSTSSCGNLENEPMDGKIVCVCPSLSFSAFEISNYFHILERLLVHVCMLEKRLKIFVSWEYPTHASICTKSPCSVQLIVGM